MRLTHRPLAENSRLAQLEPAFRRDVLEILEELTSKGWQPRIASGFRTVEEQAEKVRQGLSKTLRSAHRTGRAVDIVDRRYGWQGPAARHEFSFWVDLGEAARRRGLTWGGDWTSIRDVAHVQDDRRRDEGVWIREEARLSEDCEVPADLPVWISLGGGCCVAYQLRRRHLRIRPMPFDWIRTPTASLVDLLDGGFSRFLAADDLRLCEGPPRVLRDRRLGIVFPHDSERFVVGGAEALRRHFAPRIAAMEWAMTRAHVVLVRRGLGERDAGELRAVLRRRFPQLAVTIVGIDDRSRTRSVERRGDYLRIGVPSGKIGWSGCDSAWDWALDAVMDTLVRDRLPKTLPRLLLGRDWLQVEATLAFLRVRRAGFLAAVPPVLRQALIAAEDHRYLRHAGIDPVATLRALVGLVTGRALGGGSTIEQQLYRTMTNRRERTLGRKMRELVGARLLSGAHDKHALAACYLTLAYYGAAMNGLEQATRTLSLSLPELDEDQAAGLVARLKYPEPRAPGPGRCEQLRRRTQWVLERMKSQGVADR